MQKFKCSIFYLLTALLLEMTNACSTTSSSIIPVKYRLQSLIDEEGAKLQIGVKVVSLTTQKIVFEYQANKSFSPASVVKIFTGAAALHLLGPSFRFQTDISTDAADLTKHKVNHLYATGRGDPSLQDRDIAQIVEELVQQGVRQIDGDIILDDSYFDDIRWGGGWMWDDLPRGFSSPIGALNVNQSRIVVWVKPGFAVGHPTRLVLEPNTKFAKINNTSITGTQIAANSMTILANPKETLKLGDPILISGTMALNAAAKYQSFSVDDPALFFGQVLQEKLRAKQIKFKGQIRRGLAPVDAALLVRHESDSLGELVIDFMKWSNNHGMEILLKTMGRVAYNEPGSFRNGLMAMRSFLKDQVGLRENDLFIADGSGGSRYSLLSPAHLTRLLAYMWTNFRTGPDFVSSLPLAGEEGTLGWRFPNNDLKARIRAKTGSMTGTNALAGYMNRKNGDTLAFAIMINGIQTRPGQFSGLQEKILAQLID